MPAWMPRLQRARNEVQDGGEPFRYRRRKSRERLLTNAGTLQERKSIAEAILGDCVWIQRKGRDLGGSRNFRGIKV